MKRSLGVLAAALLAAQTLTPVTALAMDEKGAFALRGNGGQSCEAFISSVKADPMNATIAASWLMGYITAMNRIQRGTFDLLPILEPAPLMRIVAGVCARNPKASLESAAFDVLTRLGVARATQDSPIVDAKSGANTTQIRQSVLAAVQARLVQDGQLKAPADGTFGPATEAALKAYQTKSKLPVTGIPDAATVIHILVETRPKPGG